MKTAIVTGAGRGIGRACALRLGREGYSVVVCSRTGAELEETARLVAAAGGRAVVAVGDVTADGFAAEVVARAERELGGVGALVLAAGVAPLKPVEETPVALFREVLEGNLVSAYAFVHAAWAGMRRRGSGAVVTISSLASRDPFGGFTAYSAAKAGVNLMTLCLDREGKPHGIRAYAVAPGAVETAMFRKLMSPEQFPSEKALRPEEVAEVVWQCVAGALTHSGGETIFMSK